MLEKDIIALLEDNGGKNTKSSADVKIQYNKRDITAIFRKSALEKLGVEKLENYHFSDVAQLQKALEKLEKRYKEKTGVEIKLSYK